METRRFGRTNHASSVLVYGAAALGDASEQTAAASIAEARAAGINHFDTAHSYGHAEQVMGPAIGPIRQDIFLATKTERRDAEGAWDELQQSLERLGVDHIDLWQIHACFTMEDLDRCFAPDGAIHAFQRARDEGLVSYLGITGHTEYAPVVHLEALRRFDFDSVLCPLNFQLWQDPEYRDRFTALSEEIVRRDVGLRTIKAIARRPYVEHEPTYHTWYKPFDDQEHIMAAISWVLGSFPYVTGIPTAGETTLLGKAIYAEAHRMSVAEAENVLRRAEDYESIFKRDRIPEAEYSARHGG